MWRILVVALFLGVSFETVIAQDLIVTAKGDSLNCKITDIKREVIHFTFKYDNEIRSTLLPVSQIRSYKTGFYSQIEVPVEKVKTIATYQKVRIAIHGGWSYLTGKISEGVSTDYRQYLKELKTGHHFGGDIAFYPSEYVGLGVRYTMFRTQNSRDILVVTDPFTGQVKFGKFTDDITTQYIGPSVFSRFYSARKKTMVLSGFSLGYMGYKNNAMIGDSFTLTGSTVGLMVDLGFDVMIDKNLALGVGAAYTAGSLREFEKVMGGSKQTIQLTEPESLSRLDLSIGLRWSH